MELAVKFERMIGYCDEILLAPFQRDLLKGQLDYFRRQALCDVDRRENDRIIAMNWQSFKLEKKAENVIEHFAVETTFWQSVAEFVGDWSPHGPSPTGVEPHEFFALLCTDAQKRLALPSDLNKAVVCLGLKYLSAEGKLAASVRDHKSIRAVWKQIWPALKAHGLLDGYQTDPVLKSRIQNFIANGFYVRDAAGRSQVQSFGKNGRRGHPDHDYSGRRDINPRVIDGPGAVD